MTVIGNLVGATVASFLAAEVQSRPFDSRPTPLIAAIGTLAGRGLASALLLERLSAEGLSPVAYRPFADPDTLLRDKSWDLALVLSPFKREVAPRCKCLTPSAQATGVVDTIRRVDGWDLGVNTNAYAAAGALRHLLGETAPARVLIAGTGAAARSTAFGLRRLFPGAVTEVGFIGRSPERVAAIVAELGYGSMVEDAAAFGPDTVVNATTVGETDDSTPLAFDLGDALRPGVRYFDLNNRVSTLQMEALAAGCVAASGVVMQILTNALRVALLTTSSGRTEGMA